MVDIYALKRIVSGLKIKDSKVLECDDTRCVIAGSGKEPYTVTRDTCTCTDFLMNDLPCKHIYKYLDIQGELPALPELNEDAVSKFATDLPELIAMFDRYYQDGAITADKYCKIVSALSK